jgi:diguanylate cyclase (GGDEF)-like protein
VRALRIAVAIVCVVVLGLVGWLDLVASPWVSFAILYVAPVLAASWWLGRGPAIVAGIAAGLVWFAAEAWGLRGEPTRALLWNAGSRLVMLVAMATMTVRIREDRGRLMAANRRLAHHLDQAEQLARTDSLTGLANRLAFREHVEQELSRARRDRKPFAIAFLDMDDFKRVNDLHGHEAGDALLREVANVLRTSTRRADVAARLGGDEFAVLLVGAQRDPAEQAGRRLLEGVQKIADRYADARPGVSVGVAAFAEPPASADEALSRADAAMYASKERGKRQLTFWSSDERPAPAARLPQARRPHEG